VLVGRWNVKSTPSAGRREEWDSSSGIARWRSTGSSMPCPGDVVDHVQALKHGGADSPSNMQWQTKEAAKAKDKWE
jgi:hypothetical protein